MRLRDLSLTNYRNCKDLTLDLRSSKVLIIGKNAQGKTNILESISYSRENINKSADIPFVPVRIFKELSLKSVPDNEIVKTMTSSGKSVLISSNSPQKSLPILS